MLQSSAGSRSASRSPWQSVTARAPPQVTKIMGQRHPLRVPLPHRPYIGPTEDGLKSEPTNGCVRPACRVRAILPPCRSAAAGCDFHDPAMRGRARGFRLVSRSGRRLAGGLPQPARSAALTAGSGTTVQVCRRGALSRPPSALTIVGLRCRASGQITRRSAAPWARRRRRESVARTERPC